MFVWICREESTVAALQGLVGAIEREGGLDLATVKILPVSEDRPVAVPPGLRSYDDRPLGPGVVTMDNCPAGGILFLADEEDSSP
ncbi:hypothetical protein GCM10027451_29230 [Geodermatophilus aquaeductus]|uniref:Uncharacterized protein n=2 Tax=Geodermatophilus aquaeductus TaxID=1564161 RepID=A0A521F6X0_9ACTN|nr:hypothetical protein SAMN06273567_10741 [Geodermatophilus aquaeductus]